MIALLADENIPLRYINGLLRLLPEADIVRIQDIGMIGASDPAVIEYSANTNRVVLTFDAATFPRFAYDRMLAGQSFPGVLVIRQSAELNVVFNDLALVVEAMTAVEMLDTMRRIPL